MARSVAVGLIVVVTAFVGALGVYGWSFLSAVNEVDDLRAIPEAFPIEESRPEPAEVIEGNKAPVNVLVLGTDAGGTPLRNLEDIRGRRSDAMILVNISGDREHITMLSLMRDLWVEIPGRGDNKINAAMSFGGVPLAVETVESLLDVRIDHVVVTDFDGLISVTDQVGGVTINNPVGFSSSHMPGKYFEAGPQVMTGEELLAFTRERYAFSDGDYRRVQNQRLALTSLLLAVADSINPLTPWQIPQTVRTFGQFVLTDQNLSGAVVTELGIDLLGFRPGDIGSMTLPTRGTGASPDGQSIVVPDEEGIAEVSEALRQDTLYQLTFSLEDR
jgi:LCP family protein required for cell wall assembly